eukprot:6233552-Alexandrium_andersonii.AAC.1
MQEPCRRCATWSRARLHHASRNNWQGHRPDGHVPRDATDGRARLAVGRSDARPRTTGQGRD